MQRLIDANELKKQIDDNDEFDGIGIKYWIEQEPTIDAEPVVHGHWIQKEFDCVCSNCGSSNGAYGMKYCSDCGAQMDEEQECEI